MSTEPLIRELFRNLESNLHERLMMIEQILQAVEKPKVPLYDNEFVGRIEALEKKQAIPSAANGIHERFEALEEMITKLYIEVESLKRNSTVSVKQVPLVHVPSVQVPLVKQNTHTSHWEEEPEIDPEIEEEFEEEGEELELEEFIYKGRTFYKDQNEMVYGVDEEGEVQEEAIGQWNGKRILPISK
jgi:DNA repair ATPase RecN